MDLAKTQKDRTFARYFIQKAQLRIGLLEKIVFFVIETAKVTPFLDFASN